jgi:hypothetical protein
MWQQPLSSYDAREAVSVCVSPVQMQHLALNYEGTHDILTAQLSVFVLDIAD